MTILHRSNIPFAFDPMRQGAIILGGDKSGDKRWYDKHIPIAEMLYAEHLEKLKREDEQKQKARKEEGKTKKSEKPKRKGR